MSNEEDNPNMIRVDLSEAIMHVAREHKIKYELLKDLDAMKEEIKKGESLKWPSDDVITVINLIEARINDLFKKATK